MYTRHEGVVEMESKVKKDLLMFSRSTLTIDELEAIIPRDVDYQSSAEMILRLEESNILQMVKSAGRNSRTPSLANRYKINKYILNEAFHHQLQTYRLKFDNAINLDAYFSMTEAIWLTDFPYLQKIHTYITERGFPTTGAAAPERSFELVGDEKWIVEGKGSVLLQRIDLWDIMKIFPVSDPLMFAINPLKMETEEQFHLIVENKTTYEALVQVLGESIFSTLIYGVGNKITKSIENFSMQYPVKAQHVFIYFGDIDRSGISIWHVLNERTTVIPAIPFYAACLLKKRAFGKVNQRKNEQHISGFLAFFNAERAEMIRVLLNDGAYYPQEVLSTKELQQILIGTDWFKLVN